MNVNENRYLNTDNAKKVGVAAAVVAATYAAYEGGVWAYKRFFKTKKTSKTATTTNKKTTKTKTTDNH